jgi:hypothetical protein
MRYRHLLQIVILLSAVTLTAQQRRISRVVHEQAESKVLYNVDKSSETVEITNVAFEVVGPGIPGRPLAERLVLRKTTQIKQVLGTAGTEATTTVAAWPLGANFTQKPVYSITVYGSDPKTLNNEVLIMSRGQEDVEWWSIYRLGTGEHLFDTDVPLVQFSTRHDEPILRYVGIEVPPDDTLDTRLKAPNVVGVLTYASSDKVIREALLTADSAQDARLLRSFADSTHTVEFTNGRIVLSISRNYPARASTVSIAVPVDGDDLDLTRSQLPTGIRVTTWQR